MLPSADRDVRTPRLHRGRAGYWSVAKRAPNGERAQSRPALPFRRRAPTAVRPRSRPGCTTQPEIAHRRDQAARAGDRPARVKRIDVGAPALQLLAAFATGRARVRDVVDLAAKGIDLEHRLALRTRQYAHRVIKRATRRPLGCSDV